ncbi:MAG: esterase, partial [Eudoraea sp.]|nr:esterase [Eudoraea sp.]
SWLTREHTIMEKDNVMAYLDHVWQAEAIPGNCQLIIFGYSQGVSIATRFMAHNKIQPEKLIMYAGGLPEELNADSFGFLNANTKVSFIYGKQDSYLNPQRMTREQEKLNTLFSGNTTLMPYDGGHELKKELLHSLIP